MLARLSQLGAPVQRPCLLHSDGAKHCTGPPTLPTEAWRKAEELPPPPPPPMQVAFGGEKKLPVPHSSSRDTVVPLQGDRRGARGQESTAGVPCSWKEPEEAVPLAAGPRPPSTRRQHRAGRDQTDGRGPRSCQPREEASRFSARLGEISHQHPRLFGCEL